MKSRMFNDKGLTILGLIIIIAIFLVVMIVVLTLYNFNYNLFLKGFFKHDIQTNLNNASRIIVKELKHSKEINITDNNSKVNFTNLNEGSIYIENNIIKMKKGWKEENLTDIKTVIVETLKFEVEDNGIILKIKGNSQKKDSSNKKKGINEYNIELKFRNPETGTVFYLPTN